MIYLARIEAMNLRHHRHLHRGMARNSVSFGLLQALFFPAFEAYLSCFTWKLRLLEMNC